MTTRPVEQRHREAMESLLRWAAGPDRQVWCGDTDSWHAMHGETFLTGETADELAALLGIPDSAEHPAPSSEGGFDPFTAVTEWTKCNKYRTIVGPHWNYDAFEMFVRGSNFTDDMLELEIHAESARECYAIAAKRLGLTSSDQAKGDADV